LAAKKIDTLMANSSWKQKIGTAESGFFHHVFLIEGDYEDTKPALLGFFEEEFGIKIAGNPDFRVEDFESFGIDESRELRAMQLRRSFTEGAKKIFIVAAGNFTSEAQNSLLKIFEEPTEDTHFFILTPSAQFFLPTLLSRVVVVSADKGAGNSREVEAFLEKPYAKRLETALEISKDALRAQRFFDEFIRFYYEKRLKGERTEEETRVLELASKYRRYAHARSPSLKMMLEHLAIISPVI
jgi:DNA polymerase III delta prime subunit